MKVKIGSQVPEFSVLNEKGQNVSSELLKGSKYILLFYPRDNTPGCTAELCDVKKIL